MNYIKHLTGFFNKIHFESNINPTHISLYLALFQSWNVNRFKNPTGISREEIMKASKINSKATYHKCMRELQSKGFLEYVPTFNPHSSSSVIMMNFSDLQSRSLKNELLNDLTETKNEQVVERVTELPYIYNKKQTAINNLNKEMGTDTQNEPVQNLNILKNAEKEKSCAKKENSEDLNLNFDLSVPSLEITIEYFINQENTENEAQRFFNYYSSTGWLIGGKTKMKDWKAAARNWIMNQNKFKVNSPVQSLQPKNLNTSIFKNYAEPL